MRRRTCRIVVLGLIMGTVMLTGCANGSGKGPRAGLTGREVVVGAGDSGRVVELEQGQVLLVRLPERSTSLRRWQLLRAPDELVIMPDGQRFRQTEEEQRAGDLVGVQQLRFKAVGPGEAIVSLALVRPGTGLSAADERWMLQVVVR